MPDLPIRADLETHQENKREPSRRKGSYPGPGVMGNGAVGIAVSPAEQLLLKPN